MGYLSAYFAVIGDELLDLFRGQFRTRIMRGVVIGNEGSNQVAVELVQISVSKHIHLAMSKLCN